jgi:plasmid stabilization system protein ParE
LTTRYSVEVTDLADGQLRQAALWWRAQRPKSPGALREEFSRAVDLLAVQPHLGAQARSDQVPGVRRIYLRRVRYYVYYRILEDRRVVQILAFWHASRGSEPPGSGAA